MPAELPQDNVFWADVKALSEEFFGRITRRALPGGVFEQELL
ncbi:MAG: hypothetical protein RMJ56_18020 [Gemmataceae bacterium]|nr:hypothetical protein [Gemmata sp.]MDW8199493.1 hypothetical protein [Gemmataceae bacterium]